ncbi:MAG: ExbD/TolR family protein [Planctomycetota bacterium]|jgi:biopolymer transport protein ExbD
MARNFQGDQAELELNMTPMIDVVFNLLIFFMIVIDMTQKELELLTLPWSESAVEDKGDEEERRVIINVSKSRSWDQDAAVEIRVKSELYDLDGLKDLMFKHAETKRDMTHPMKPSEIFAMIRCDKDIRWREVQWVMQACADPEVRIYKLQFATEEPREDQIKRFRKKR